jgi:calcineurin-like phosphoesterase family protein
MDKIHILLSETEKIFFTSDLHFEHRNILSFCHRPYDNIKQMNEELIKNWNNTVSDNDTVFILGDIYWFEGRHECKRLLEQLNGKTIYIVPGNHDKIKTFELLSERFVVLDSCVTLWVTIDGKIKELFLCHFPLATWPHFENGAIHLFGHIHSGPLSENKIDIPKQDLILKPNCYDVGVDNNNFTPIELREIYNKLNYDKS